MAYNGWANRETWCVSMYYGDYFAELAENAVEDETSVETLADQIADAFYECETFPTNGVISDLLQPALDAIDWLDLALYSDAVNNVED
ncbi:MAG: hypothetical protein RBS17_07970 [Coriobacteriia bacterium]|nr:hypothetical protein [Coriobacteriia bacterium]